MLYPQTIPNRNDIKHILTHLFSKMLNNSTILSNEEETKTFARTLAQSLKSNNIVLFNGGLGVGKTFFCREIIKYFCGENTAIISPTFNLLQTYKASNFTIYHYDLYRLKSPEEIYELGLEEALNGNLTLIEWSEIIKHLLPTPLIKVNLEVLDNNKRFCKIYSIFQKA